MHILAMNTYILLHMDNSIIANHIHQYIFINHGVNLQLKHFKNNTAISIGNGTRKWLATA